MTDKAFSTTNELNSTNVSECEVWCDYIYLDTDENGTVDRVDVTYSEDISASSTYDAGDWSFSAVVTESTGAISGLMFRLMSLELPLILLL